MIANAETQRYAIDRIGMSIELDDDSIILTRDMDDSTVLEQLGMTKSDLLRNFELANIYLQQIAYRDINALDGTNSGLYDSNILNSIAYTTIIATESQLPDLSFWSVDTIRSGLLPMIYNSEIDGTSLIDCDILEINGIVYLYGLVEQEINEQRYCTLRYMTIHHGSVIDISYSVFDDITEKENRDFYNAINSIRYTNVNDSSDFESSNSSISSRNLVFTNAGLSVYDIEGYQVQSATQDTLHLINENMDTIDVMIMNKAIDTDKMEDMDPTDQKSKLQMLLYYWGKLNDDTQYQVYTICDNTFICYKESFQIIGKDSYALVGLLKDYPVFIYMSDKGIIDQVVQAIVIDNTNDELPKVSSSPLTDYRNEILYIDNGFIQLPISEKNNCVLFKDMPTDSASFRRMNVDMSVLNNWFLYNSARLIKYETEIIDECSVFIKVKTKDEYNVYGNCVGDLTMSQKLVLQSYAYAMNASSVEFKTINGIGYCLFETPLLNEYRYSTILNGRLIYIFTKHSGEKISDEARAYLDGIVEGISYIY